MQNQSNSNEYILGHAGDELGRLERQAELFGDATEAIFSAAGISEGMRVLDVGCGAGDVAMLAGRLVGPSGTVLAIDRSEEALAVAARRAAAKGLGQIEFAKRDIADLAADGERFDAVTGRFLLLHFADPTPILRGVASLLKPGGVVAFAEMDIRSTSATPAFPLLERCVGWIVELYRRSGLEPDMGSKLYGAFKAAGLKPELKAACRIETGLEGGGLAYLVGTLQTMKPALIGLGVASAEELDIPSLTRQLADDMVAGDHCVVYPRLIGAWAKL
nr:class I SAM-dependent methyltransferase [Methylopila sp. M107]